ncbi:MAG: SWIM zinc finger family protein [Promethearchaeota archaeon]
MYNNRKRKHEEVKQIKRDLINFARSEWGKKWIKSTLKFGRPYRMRRGIEYAKDIDRIDNIIISKGQIFATVQGTAPSPYRVKIKFEQIPEQGWEKIIKELSGKAINLIKLLNGVLPEDIISIFERNNFPLFLDVEISETNASCSCPDQTVPCKHIAATILYIARVVDYNPFLLLELRGKTKSELLNALNLQKDISQEKAEKRTKKEKKAENIIYRFNAPKIDIKDINFNENGFNIVNNINFGFSFKKPAKIIETLENIGSPPALQKSSAFEHVFEKIYRTISLKTYEKATSFNRK